MRERLAICPVLVLGVVLGVAAGCTVTRMPPTKGAFHSPGPISAVAFGHGSVWVKELQKLARCDPGRYEVVALIPLGRGAPGYWELAVTEDAVWALNSADNSLSQVDPLTNHVEATIPVGRVPMYPSGMIRIKRMWVGEGSVWVLNYSDETVTRIDTRSHQVLATIPVERLSNKTFFGDPIPFGSNLSIAEGAVWVENPEGTLSRIDLQANRVVATVPAGRGARVGEGAVWALDTKTGTLSRMDLQTYHVSAKIRVESGASALALGGGAVWIFNARTGVLSQIDPRTNSVVANIPVGRASSGFRLEIHAGAVWVFREDELSRIDPASHTVAGTIVVGPWWKGFAWGEGVIWLVIGGAGGLDAVSPVTLP